MPAKRLVVFVEGQGDEKAAILLAKHFLNQFQGWDCLRLDDKGFRIGGFSSVSGKTESNWPNKIKVAAKGKNLGAVLLLLDGDEKKEFCAAQAARKLAEKAKEAGAGSVFSVAVVFALKEFETWLIASVEALAGKPLPDGRPGINQGVKIPNEHLEEEPRGAKEWLSRNMEGGYKETSDQEPLTRLMLDHLELTKVRDLKSFKRLESAFRQLVEAARTGNHISTPGPKK